MMLRILLASLFIASNAHAASNRILECAGQNTEIKGCDGHIRLYIFEDASGQVEKAMLYSTTIVNSSQTWHGTAIMNDNRLVQFDGDNKAGGTVALQLSPAKSAVLKVAKPACLPEFIRGMSGFAAKLSYIAVYKPVGRPAVRETGKNIDLVCRDAR